ncbi:MAG: GNAT family N-acetyltransferase [Nitrososphaerota archaeon]|jgi:GNAT superfamily N-acetyltransferase|nr:GNAT family N-acetyltransferase [Nitrososphaerota archaeon]
MPATGRYTNDQMLDSIIVAQGRTIDYKEFARYGFRFLVGFSNFRILFNQENVTMIAYSTNQKKPVGIIYLQKITENLWGIWSTFIHPAFRGRGIAPQLYNKSFEFLKKKGIKKAIGTVSFVNKPSIASIQKTWDGFLNRVNYKLNFFDQTQKPTTTCNILNNMDTQNLWEIFSTNTGAEWINFLEINKENFIDRVFGSAGCEAYSKKTRRLLIQKRLVEIKQNNRELLSYAIYTKNGFFNNFQKRVQYLEPPHLFAGNISNLRKGASSLFKVKGFQTYHYLGTIEEEGTLKKEGFEILDKEIICFKKLA